MDLTVNEEFTKMYSEDELLGARRIQVKGPARATASIRPKGEAGSCLHSFGCLAY